MKLGHGTLADAMSNRTSAVVLTQQQRLGRMMAKEPIYAEYEALHPGVVDDPKSLQGYRIFWRKWTTICPAWRADRLDDAKQTCGAIAIVFHRDDESDLIFCPECEYAGDAFHA